MGIYRQARVIYNTARHAAGHWKNTLLDKNPKLLVLVYHRVLPELALDPLCMVVRAKTFTRQVEELARRFPVISLTDAAGQCRSGRSMSKVQAVLTFDDGYADNFETVFPVLRKKGLVATFFVPTDFLDGNAKFPDGRLYDRKTGALHNHVKGSFLNWDEAKAIGRGGMEIGSHGKSHCSLASMPLEAARKEIIESKKAMEANLQRPCDHFAFPFGSRHDYNETLVDCVKGAGYKTCMLNMHGYNRFSGDIFCFRRIIMEETTSISHLFG